MKKICIALCSLFVTIACNQNSAAQNVSVIDVDQFEIKLQDLTKVQVIDVRTPAEVSNGFIEGAIFMDYKNANFESELQKLDKDKPILIYCASGGRSGKTAKKLSELKFKEIYDLNGGIGAWKAAGKSVVIPE